MILCRQVSEISWKRILELSASFYGGQSFVSQNWPDDDVVAAAAVGGDG